MSARSVGLAGWCVLAVAAVALEVCGRSGRAGTPTAGQVMTAIVRARFGRASLLLGWAILGWHLFLAPAGG